MELKEFIKTVLVDIFKAIKETREQLDSEIGSEAGRNICPMIPHPDRKMTGTDLSGCHHREINFDVAVTVEANKENEVSGKIQVFSLFQGGAEHKNINIQTNVSRVQFNIPIRFTPPK